jgi:Leucine-rich repeat (LRR) protein
MVADLRPLMLIKSLVAVDDLHGLYRRIPTLMPNVKAILMDDIDFCSTQMLAINRTSEQIMDDSDFSSDSWRGGIDRGLQGLIAVANGFRPLVLSIRRCERIAVSQISQTLYYDNLIYLDFSYTQISGYPDSFWSANLFRHLRILKMRGMRITDSMFEKMVGSVAPFNRIFSLDVRGNNLTGKSIPLLARMMLPNLSDDPRLESVKGMEMYLDDAPCYAETQVDELPQAIDRDGNIRLRPDDAFSTIKYLRDHGFLYPENQHTIEQDTTLMRRTGLTNLHISDNRLRNEDLRELLSRSNRIQHLGFGRGMLDLQLLKSQSTPILSLLGSLANVRITGILGTHRLANLLSPQSARRLESLRVHHCLVTNVPSLAYDGGARLPVWKEVEITEHTLQELREELRPPFAPDHNPRLRVLCLTDIPRKTTGVIVDRLFEFIVAAAKQEREIQLAQQNLRSQKGVKFLSGLRKLVLEFVPEHDSQRMETCHAGAGRYNNSSVTGDEDADAFHAASEGDFSFFSDSRENGAAGLGDSNDSYRELKRAGDRMKEAELIDVIEQLRLLRRERLVEFEKERARLGCNEWEVPKGAPHFYWTGEIEVIIKN